MAPTDMVEDTTVKKKTAEQVAREAFLETLANLGGRLNKEDDIVFEGTRLVIPATMDVPQAIDTLRAKLRADEEETSFSRVFKFRPWDGALATRNALYNAFGVVQGKATYSFFGKNPPQMMTINVDHDKTEQVPWGALTIPHLDGVTLHLGSTRDPEMGLLYVINVSGPRRWRFHIEGIFTLVQEELEKNSMYRGRAFDGQDNPSFLDLRGIDPSKVIYSEEVMTQLDANVWSVIEYTEQMERLGVPLKRAVLLEGPYGTGKTLAAYLTAQRAIENGWTFIYCRPAKDDLEDVMRTAQLYQPAIVFYEDVDTLASGGDDVTRMLDIFDGISAKGTKIVAMLTTNHVEQIHKGMVRPGRLDAVIHIGALDHAGVAKLVRATVPDDMLKVDDDQWESIGVAMEDFMPAFCREAIDRAVRYSVARNKGQTDMLSAQDFIDAAHGLRPQLELMEGASDKRIIPTIEDRIAAGVIEKVADSLVVDPGGNDWPIAVVNDN